MVTTKIRIFPGQYESLDKIRDFAGKAARAAGLSEDAVYAVQLAVDEASSNIIEHAYGGEGRGDIECLCLIEPTVLTVKLHDSGRPFDPSCVIEPDLQCALDDRRAGGLGLVLINRLMDEVRFDFNNDGNTLTLVKRGS